MFTDALRLHPSDGLVSGDLPAEKLKDLHLRLAPIVGAAEEGSLRTCYVCGEPDVRRGRTEDHNAILAAASSRHSA
jgi:hypothetical protein